MVKTKVAPTLTLKTDPNPYSHQEDGYRQEPSDDTPEVKITMHIECEKKVPLHKLHELDVDAVVGRFLRKIEEVLRWSIETVIQEERVDGYGVREGGC